MIDVPEAFKAYRQFILFRAEPGENGKIVKRPVSPHTLKVHDPHDPAIHVDYATAASLADACDLGVGFVFTEQDPFFFLDLDAHFANGQWSQLAQQFCQVLAGCAVEVSISGTGLHIFGTAKFPPHECEPSGYGVALYTEKRFVALTGNSLTGDAATVIPQHIIDWMTTNFFPAPQVEKAEWTNQPDPAWHGPTDDNELLQKMYYSRSATTMFGGKASFADLWDANPEVLGRAYPSTTGAPYDHSSADAALCAHLAFWTGKDAERMDRFFRASKLVRDKWIDREDYRVRTILNAMARCKEVYGSKNGEKMTPELAATMSAGTPDGDVRIGYQFLSIQQQVEHFAGCVYVRDLHRVLTKDGALLKSDQFRAMYGGFIFALDAMNNKTTKSAWEAFTESQGIMFPKAFGACFRPECQPREIIEEEGGTLVNTYVPVPTVEKQGDPTRFLHHVARLLPDPRDQQIILSYMAAVVQYPGKKFQWTPLIQGIEGNGKTLFAMVLANAVGWKYVHIPNNRDITNTFNSWILGKLVIIVEEVYVRDKMEATEALKPLITNQKIEIHGKGANQITGDNRANFFMCTNHKDAIRKTRTDRRYCVFYTAQQNPGDIDASGMGGRYFPEIYKWLEHEGYAIVNNYLKNYPIADEFNPAKYCHRAPITSSTGEAFSISLGGLEQDIIEAGEDGRYGFCGGWISSLQLNQLLKERRDDKRITPNRRKQIITELGYIQHPYLKGGRANNNLIREGGKPVLYLKKGHPALVLTAPTDIVRAYQTDQEC